MCKRKIEKSPFSLRPTAHFQPIGGGGLSLYGEVQVNEFEQVQVVITWGTPRTDRLTDIPEIISFPQLLWRAVKMIMNIFIFPIYAIWAFISQHVNFGETASNYLSKVNLLGCSNPARSWMNSDRQQHGRRCHN